MSGWFAIKHGITEHSIFKGRPERLGAWVVMLDKAAFADVMQDVQGRDVLVKRGELCASQAQLEKWTGLPRQQLRTLLNRLEAAGTIKTRPALELTKGRTIVTFCNYEKYQAPQPRTNQGPTKDQPTKEQDNNIPVGEADKSASDPAKIIFSQGLDILTQSGVSDKQARSLLGRWRRDHGEGNLISALGRAKREGAIQPVEFITGCLRFAAKKSNQPQQGQQVRGPDGVVREFEPGVGWQEVYS